MTQVGESVAPTMVNVEDVEETHYAGLEICYPNGEPYQDYVSIRPVVDGNETVGTLNFEGMCWSTMLDPGASVCYEVGDEVDDELANERQAIKVILDSIIESERAQQARDDALLAEENRFMQGLILTGAFMTGVGDGALGLLEFGVDVVEVGGKSIWFNLQSQANMLETAWEKYGEGDQRGYFDSLNEKNVEDFANIFGVTPQEITDQMAKAYEILAFVMEDSELQSMLLQFAEDYVLAQSKVEAANIVGSAAFDIILTALLAVTTGGAGNAAHALSKVRHAGRFANLAARLQRFVRLAKQKRLRRTVEGRLDDTVRLEVEAPPATRLERNTVEDSDFQNRHTESDQRSTDSETQQQGNDASQTENASQSGDQATNESGANQSGQTCSADSRTCTGGEPISLVTGEEILPLVDFTLHGPLILRWERKYKSSNPHNIGLGHGWSHTFADRLIETDAGLELHNAEARVIPFALPAIGRESTNLAEKLTIKRLSQTGYVLKESGSTTEKLFEAVQGGQGLRLSQIRDRVGNRFYFYYQHDRLERIQAGFGDVWEIDYQNGNIAEISWCSAEGKRKKLVSYQYDAKHDLIVAKDALGHGERYKYQNHLITKRTLKSGYSFHFQWDGAKPGARCLRNWGDHINGKPTYDYTFNWDTVNKAVSVTDTRGGVTTHQFNDAGLPVLIRDPEGGETRYFYDHFGNLVREVDPLGHTQHYQYNRSQQLIGITNKKGFRSQFQWDANGNQTQVQNASGQRWQSNYNGLGQLISRTNPLGETYRYQYNDIGMVNAVTDPEGNAWHFVWNNQARLIASRNPLGQNTRYTYNDEGQVTAVTYANGQTQYYSYDANGNCTSVTDTEGKTQKYEYSSLGLLSTHTDAQGKQTLYEYNGLSQVVRRIDPTGQRLDYYYDGERNLVGLTNEKGEQYRLDYDLNERLVQEVGFDGRIQRYQYNPAGQLVKSQDLSLDATSVLSEVHYHRDAEGRLLKQIDGLSGKRLNRFEYDELGRLQSASNAYTDLNWQYDAIGRVVTDQQGKHRIKHSYNGSGRRTASLLPNGDEIHYGFDASGAFSSLGFNGEQVVDIQRDELGREVQRSLSNNLATEQSYDPQGRLVRQSTYRQKVNDAQSPRVSERRYAYNNQGLLGRIDDALRGTTRYQYDALERLTKVQGPNPETFVHDPAGNILHIQSGSGEQKVQTSFQQSKGNRLTFQGDTHYRYDDRGNRVAQGRGKNKSIRSFYKYNALNQLIAIKNNKGQTQYAYDPLGRRIIKSSKEKRTGFLWLDNVLLSEITQHSAAEGSEAKQEQKTYLYEPGTFKPLALVQDKNVYHYHLDHLGTPQEITDSTGKLVWAVSYRAYGNLAVAHKNEIQNNLRFQGQYFDEESGLHYNRFRYYDPECGRFINQDPIGLLGGLNNYQYVPNPTGWVDPLGLACKEGYAEVYHYKGDASPHFAVVTERNGARVGSEQWGGQGTKTLDIEFDPNQPQDMELVGVYRVKLPDVESAQRHQTQIIREGEYALSRAGYEPSKLDTPDYCSENQSCLTHVFNVLNEGGKSAPMSSPANFDTARYIRGLQKESISLGN